MKRTRSERAFQIFNYAFFILIGLVTLYPFWYTLLESIIPFSDFADTVVLLYPSSLEWGAYQKIFSNNTFVNAFLITTFVTTTGTFASLCATALAAYGLSKKDLPGGKVIFLGILFTMLFQGGLVPLYIIMANLRLINKIAVYILWPLVSTFYLIIMRTNFRGIPQSLEDSAKIDGCNDLAIFFRIVLPMSLPIIATIGLFYSVNKWNTLPTALYFIRDPRKLTLQAVLYNMVSSVDLTSEVIIESTDVIPEQVKAAAIIVSMIPILLVYPFLQRYFVKGVLIGAIKE